MRSSGACFLGLAIALALLGMGADTMEPTPGVGDTVVGPGLGDLSPLNASVAPCSLLNFSTILGIWMVDQPWTGPQIRNLSHYAGVISLGWNETCVQPAFVSMAQAHIRSPLNFTYGTGQAGVYTANASGSADFGGEWQASGRSYEEVWVVDLTNGTLTGPWFSSGPTACGCAAVTHQAAGPSFGLVLPTVAGTAVGLAVVAWVVIRYVAPRRPRPPTGSTDGVSPSSRGDSYMPPPGSAR